MHKAKSEFPQGRSKKKKGAKAAHKQHVAMCLNQEGYENHSAKQLIEGMSFSSFLITERMVDEFESNAKGFIKDLPQFKELMKDAQHKPEALKLARQLIDEFGNSPISQQDKEYIFDTFDELSSKIYQGANIGDWKGETEFRNRKNQERDYDKMSDEWESTVGTDAETGAELPIKHSRGTRVGLDHNAAKKIARAQSDLGAFANAPSDEQMDRLSAAKNITAGAAKTKMATARYIFNKLFGNKAPSEIINDMVTQMGISRQHATTYYYNIKRQAGV